MNTIEKGAAITAAAFIVPLGGYQAGEMIGTAYYDRLVLEPAQDAADCADAMPLQGEVEVAPSCDLSALALQHAAEAPTDGSFFVTREGMVNELRPLGEVAVIQAETQEALSVAKAEQAEFVSSAGFVGVGAVLLGAALVVVTKNSFGRAERKRLAATKSSCVVDSVANGLHTPGSLPA